MSGDGRANGTARRRIVDQLIRHEGLRLKVYTDGVGVLTIGVGRNLTDKGISNTEALYLLDHDIDEAVTDLASFPWFVGLSDAQQLAMVDMRHNLGPFRFRQFKQMIHALAVGDYAGASAQLLRSRWATQVQPSRRDCLVAQLAGGEEGS